jgi:hypothetical protein
VHLEASTKRHVHQKFEIFWTNIASTIACPNFQTGPKNDLRPLGIKGLFTIVTKGHDQSFSCIVIGGKVGAGPSSLYTVKNDQGLQWMKK